MLDKFARDELTGRIKDKKVLDAFDFLVSGMEGLGRYELRPSIAGSKKALHFFSSGASNYAFIANGRWLLWYFRKPGFNAGIFSWHQLQSAFPLLQKSKRAQDTDAEATLKIMTVADANAVLDFVKNCSG